MKSLLPDVPGIWGYFPMTADAHPQGSGSDSRGWGSLTRSRSGAGSWVVPEAWCRNGERFPEAASAEGSKSTKTPQTPPNSLEFLYGQLIKEWQIIASLRQITYTDFEMLSYSS